MRQWWAHRQGLLGPYSSLTDSLEITGWVRSVGGATPYLSLRARTGASRSEIDDLVKAGEICELPAARGCTYVVAKSDFALAVRCGQTRGECPAISLAVRHLGVTHFELDNLCHEVLRALQEGALEPSEIRKKLGARVRNLGEEGKKKGVTSTLPLCLERLQDEGRIKRIPMNGRLDQQQYRYELWAQSPIHADLRTPEEIELDLARKYFLWLGLASQAHFQWFSGYTVKSVKRCIEELGLAKVSIGSDLIGFPEDLEAFRKFKPVGNSDFRLVGSLDGLFLLTRDIKPFVEEDQWTTKTKGTSAGASLGADEDLIHHAIVDRGQLVGLWDYDPETHRIVSHCFIERTQELTEAITSTERFIREDLGDAKTFSLDGPSRRKSRLERLRNWNLN